MRDEPHPCPATWRVSLSRDTADLARLAHYARKLDADVIAFQEVENAARGHGACSAAMTSASAQALACSTRASPFVARLAHRCESARDRHWRKATDNAPARA